MRRRPDLFIIGAPKCGTTSMYRYLGGHPEIYLSPRKEPKYFAPDLPSGPRGKNYRHGQDLERYLNLFSGAGDEKRLGEATTRYLFSRAAPVLIRDFQPRPYLVAMLREPVAFIESLHAHKVAGMTEYVTDIEEALSIESDRGGRGLRPTSNPELFRYRERARFGKQLQRWLDVFPRERIHVVILEDMLADPAAEFRRLLEFLEVDPDYQPASFMIHNPRHEPRIKALKRLMASPAGRWVIWRIMPAVFGELGARRVVHPVGRLNRRRAARRTMPPHLRQQLEAELAPDVALLSQLLGRDMAALWWGDDGARGTQRV